MTWAAVAGGAVAVGGSIFGGIASGNAASAQEQAAKAGLREQQRALGMQLGLTEPGRYLGYQAQGDLAHLYGYGMAPYATGSQLNEPTMDADAFIQAMRRTGSFEAANRLGRLGTLNEQEIAKLTAAGITPAQIQQLQALPGGGGQPGQPGGAYGGGGNPSLSRFWASPDYQFRRDEGTRGIEQQFSAGGQGFYSGDTMRALNENNSNLASGEFGNYFNRLATMAGIGQTANAQAGQAVQSAGNNMTDLYGRQGDARASGIMGTANSITGSISDGLQLWALMKGMKT